MSLFEILNAELSNFDSIQKFLFRLWLGEVFYIGEIILQIGFLKLSI